MLYAMIVAAQVESKELNVVASAVSFAPAPGTTPAVRGARATAT